jgi:hypothetical protein
VRYLAAGAHGMRVLCDPRILSPGRRRRSNLRTSSAVPGRPLVNWGLREGPPREGDLEGLSVDLICCAVERTEGDAERRQPHVELVADHLDSRTWASAPATDGYTEGRPSWNDAVLPYVGGRV